MRSIPVNVPEIIAAAAASPLGIASLVCLLGSFVCVSLFDKKAGNKFAALLAILFFLFAVLAITMLMRSSDNVPEPDKTVLDVPKGQLLSTTGFWRHGQKSRSFPCSQESLVKPGFELVQGPPSTKTARGCAPKEHCNGHGETCVSYYREAACIVNSDWMNWYRKQASLISNSIDIDFICKH